MVYELVNVYCREMSTVVGHPYGHESLVKDVYWVIRWLLVHDAKVRGISNPIPNIALQNQSQ